MTQLVGTSKIQHNYSNIDQGDAKLQQQLAVYKTPATIRDMKQTFFYLQINADTTVTHPAILYTGRDKRVAVGFPIAVNPYYLPLGTKRPFRIGEAVNSLLDIRVPKDKYVIEINLVEAQIEANPANWTMIPEIALTEPAIPGQEWGAERVFKIRNDYVVAPSGTPGAPPNQTTTTQNADPPNRLLYTTAYDQASKESIPQSMFCRITGCNNGEPYNWVVTNNGQVALDKSHLLMVKHGDLNYDDLELEFGHLIFKGSNTNYADFIANEVYNDQLNVVNVPNIDTQVAKYTPEQRATALATFGEKKRFSDYEYLDYNWEWQNSIGEPYSKNKDRNELDYANIYPAARNFTRVQTPASAQFNGGGQPAPNLVDLNPLFLKRDPLKSNQQCSNMYFRFMIRCIHLF